MKKILKYLVVSILSISLGVCGTLITLHYFPIKNNETIKTSKEISIIEENTIRQSINKVYDGVVYIETYKASVAIGTGSGFVYKTDDDFGYILTNNHVVQGATKVYITNSEGITSEATVLGNDSYLDLAVLAVNKDNVISVCGIGDSTKSHLGDTIFTVGSPMGKEYMGSVTKGIISGKDRKITINVNSSAFLLDVIQVDAAINPGNSGGPLVNINGEVIGITSAKLVDSNIEGMGFAIPIEMAMSSISKLESGEKIERPAIGVGLIDASNTYSLKINRIKINDDIKSGAVIASLEDGYPAKEAGLKVGDVITEIDDQKVSNSASLKYLLYKYEIGSTVTIKYNRSGKTKEAKLVLNKVLGN